MIVPGGKTYSNIQSGLSAVKRPVSLLGGKLKMILKDLDGEAWTGLIWLRIGTGGGLL